MNMTKYRGIVSFRKCIHFSYRGRKSNKTSNNGALMK